MDPSLVKLLEEAQETTRRATEGSCRMVLNIALNYSGRCEIVDACRRIVSDWAAGKGTDIDEDTLGRYLYTSGQSDPDLLVRTSGEMRLSNFLLWQMAYTELWFEAILAFQARQRRFGGVAPESDADSGGDTQEPVREKGRS